MAVSSNPEISSVTDSPSHSPPMD
ncbi:hypothetical protein CCACVL1_29717, partial [Corchorus capsularis]